MTFILTPEMAIEAYRLGYFPMAESVHSEKVFLISPEKRGILPIEGFHIPRSLKKQLRAGGYEIRVDHDFETVIKSCAEITPDRQDTWINKAIEDLFISLHEAGSAHSVECWKNGGMAGGVYGLALGGAFFGESMFSRESGASKIALVHLVARLWKSGFKLLDTQWSNPHLTQFGCFEVPAGEYLEMLKDALGQNCTFPAQKREEEILNDYLRHSSKT